MIANGGAFGLIATNTIGQEDTRETGLAPILRDGGRVYAATRRLVWPGEAAVVVSVVHIGKQADEWRPRLDGKPVQRISAYLVEGDLDDLPKPLSEHSGEAFIGSYALGMGFTFDDEGAGDGIGRPTSLAEMRRLIATNPRNQERIFPYIGGEEVNNDPEQKPHRYVIDFFDRPLKVVSEEYPDLIEIVKRKVKPERDVQKRDALRERWWQYAEKRPGLISANLGLTKTYNRFHDPDESASDIVKLRQLHHDIDCAVLGAYGWRDLAAQAQSLHLTERDEDEPKYQGRLF
ncbi:hypothetical protein [Reyranella sp.]|uniref:hypothetical protein n=1 Tax=Reyranella sp. TaxID=1929291 RepID=UPI003782FCA0